MLPRPVCPLAGHATLGQNVVVGSMTILLSWLCWGACQEEVCLDPRCLCNLTLPRFSVELPLRDRVCSIRGICLRAFHLKEEYVSPATDCACCGILRDTSAGL